MGIEDLGESERRATRDLVYECAYKFEDLTADRGHGVKTWNENQFVTSLIQCVVDGKELQLPHRIQVPRLIAEIATLSRLSKQDGNEYGRTLWTDKQKTSYRLIVSEVTKGNDEEVMQILSALVSI